MAVTEWIDKSALVRLADSPNADLWAERIERGLVRITTVIRLEVGYSARTGEDTRSIFASPPFSSMPVEYLTPTIEDRAVQVQLLLAGQGQACHPSPSVFAQKAGVPLAFAEQVVNGVHTSPTAVGKVFKRAGARMSVMWHLAVDHETVGPAVAEMRAQYDGPVTVAQDLTRFTITKAGVVTGQATVDPYAWPVLGPTTITGPPMSAPKPPPAWWADALITD